MLPCHLLSSLFNTVLSVCSPPNPKNLKTKPCGGNVIPRNVLCCVVLGELVSHIQKKCHAPRKTENQKQEAGKNPRRKKRKKKKKGKLLCSGRLVRTFNNYMPTANLTAATANLTTSQRRSISSPCFCSVGP